MLYRWQLSRAQVFAAAFLLAIIVISLVGFILIMRAISAMPTIARDAQFYESHREQFTEVVSFAQQECSEADYSCTLPAGLQSSLGTDRLFVCKYGNAIQYIVLASPAAGSFTYLPPSNQNEEFVGACSYAVGCLETLGDDWFICKVSRD